MRHTDRNRWKLAPDVVFEDKKKELVQQAS